MGSLTKKFLYRIFCVAALFVAIYLMVDLQINKTLEGKVIVVFTLFVIVTVWGIVDWKQNYDLIARQESELRMYQLYIKPLEELVKEIRAKQHEFDNHKNAILNMHRTIDTYEELVIAQAVYIREVTMEDQKQFMPLLRISDKILAGFLYSKIVSTQDYIKTQLEVKSLEIISKISEHSLIEIVGTLVDNAYEACTREQNHVIIVIDSSQDRLLLHVKNQVEKIPIREISRFFEKGYSTKSQPEKRGLGLYRAKMLIDKHKGEIIVGQENIQSNNYIVFQAIL